MTTEEILLTVLTASIVVLIIMVLVVLVVVLQTVRRLKKVTTEVQHLTERGTMAAERMAPVSMVAMSAVQIASLFLKRVRS